MKEVQLTMLKKKEDIFTSRAKYNVQHISMLL